MTSKLQEHLARTLHTTYPWLRILENHRPEWLTDQQGRRLELDLYFEDLHLAVEVQGVQHFSYVEHFHGDGAGYEDQQERDAAKRAACAAEGIVLVEIAEAREIPSFLALLDRRLVPSAPPPGPKARRTAQTEADIKRLSQRIDEAVGKAEEADRPLTLIVSVKQGKGTGDEATAVRVYVQGPMG